MKLHRVVQSILLLLVMVTATSAQTRQEPSLSQRAQQLEPFIVASAQRYGVDFRILRALCFIESRYRINVVSPKGARGPMQFIRETAERYGLRDPHDPRAAIDAAARYLRDLLKRFGGRVDLALAAYNAGEGAVTSFMTGKRLILRSGKIVNPLGLRTGGIPPYLETQKYVRSALALLPLRDYFPPKQTGNRISGRGRPNVSKNFTLDAYTDSQKPLSKALIKGSSSFIEIQ